MPGRKIESEIYNETLRKITYQIHAILLAICRDYDRVARMRHLVIGAVGY